MDELAEADCPAGRRQYHSYHMMQCTLLYCWLVFLRSRIWQMISALAAASKPSIGGESCSCRTTGVYFGMNHLPCIVWPDAICLPFLIFLIGEGAAYCELKAVVFATGSPPGGRKLRPNPVAEWLAENKIRLLHRKSRMMPYWRNWKRLEPTIDLLWHMAIFFQVATGASVARLGQFSWFHFTFLSGGFSGGNCTGRGCVSNGGFL